MDNVNELARPIRPAAALLLALGTAAYLGVVACGVMVILHAVGARLALSCAGAQWPLWWLCV